MAHTVTDEEREDARRDVWFDARYKGDCPECGEPVVGRDYPATREEPASGYRRCTNSKCGYEGDY